MAAWDDRQTWRGKETIEQAALARATGNDWQGRARREAAVILAEVLGRSRAPFDEEMLHERYDTLVVLLALAWLQGFNLGAHETLADAEQAFERLKDAL